MAHGNFSDLVFLVLMAAVVQLLAFPDTLFQDLGPLKQQLRTKSRDLDAIIKLTGGLLLMIGLTFSGVKWNPINGKMAGIACFIAAGTTAYSNYKADADVFVPRLFYIYAAVIFLGGLHIFFFPSNPLLPKSPEVKNNHGNASDAVAFGLLLPASLLCYVYPEHLFQDFGPVKAQFTSKSADLSAMIKVVGGLLLIVAMMLSGVKWNPINGKMAGFGGFIAAGYTAYSTYKADGEAFVPKAFYLYAAAVFLGALHIFVFPSNPLLSTKKAGKQK
eukprot:TRINITY_DN76621_c0_g1_i1.p1 TRINITY_DN76621_c0_g1~~TRINITY_DN76621_c0_g1_i1.p1  ORF type:complete len:299 (+),score=78.23 TRINITY_DN76621_c0_g1_i1:78-899(+)